MEYRDIYFGYAIKGVDNYKKMCEVIKSSFLMGFIDNSSSLNEQISKRISVIDDLYNIIFMDDAQIEHFVFENGYHAYKQKDGSYNIHLSGSFFITPEISIIVVPNKLVQLEIGVHDKFYSIAINIKKDEFSIYTGFNSPMNKLQLEKIKERIM